MTLLALTMQAQEFEAASVKMSGPQSERGSDGGPGTSHPGRFTFGRANLRILLMKAWSVENFQVLSRLPIDEELYDVSATVPADTTKDQFRLMLRRLLEERFHLRAHTEQREFGSFTLLVGKGGAKLSLWNGVGTRAPREWIQSGFPELALDRPAMASINRRVSGGVTLVQMKLQGQPLSVLASLLRTHTGDPVVDQSGLSGLYDFTLEFATGEGTDPANAPELSTALQRLGLQLVRRKAMFPVVVVDSVDASPTAN